MCHPVVELKFMFVHVCQGVGLYLVVQQCVQCANVPVFIISTGFFECCRAVFHFIWGHQ